MPGKEHKWKRPIGTVPSIHTITFKRGATDVDRIRTAVDIGHRIRRPNMPVWCGRAAFDALPKNATAAEIEAVLIDPANGWKPHNSLEALIDQWEFYRNRKERLRSRTMHVANLIKGEFAKMRLPLEQLLIARVGDFDIDNLRTLAGWMNEPGNHPNPQRFFKDQRIFPKLPKAFVKEDLPGLRTLET